MVLLGNQLFNYSPNNPNAQVFPIFSINVMDIPEDVFLILIELLRIRQDEIKKQVGFSIKQDDVMKLIQSTKPA